MPNGLPIAAPGVMNTVDLGFWLTFAAGFAAGIGWCKREALAEWLVGLFDEEPSRPAVRSREHPSIRILRDGPYDWTRDEEREA